VKCGFRTSATSGRAVTGAGEAGDKVEKSRPSSRSVGQGHAGCSFSRAGTVGEIKIAIGDKVSKAPSSDARCAGAAASAKVVLRRRIRRRRPRIRAGRISAAFAGGSRAKDCIDRAYPSLGGVCLNVDVFQASIAPYRR